MNKMFRFWVLLLLVVWTTFIMLPELSTSLTTPSSSISESSEIKNSRLTTFVPGTSTVIVLNPGMTVPIGEDCEETKSSIKEHKGKNYGPSTEKKVNNEGNLNLEDYHQIDPAPSSRATIKYGPIEHGTPLLPYIPKPTPPYHPIHAVSPSPS